MWTCPSCGEQHEDQFKECWKCFGKELQHAVSATPLRPKLPTQPPALRSTGAVVMRMLVGVVVGFVLGGAVYQRWATSLGDSLQVAVVTGCVFAFFVGVYFWVLFPYERVPADPLAEEHELPRQSPD